MAFRLRSIAREKALPVVVPTQFELIVHRRAASALGLALTPSLLARADEVLE